MTRGHMTFLIDIAIIAAAVILTIHFPEREFYLLFFLLVATGGYGDKP